MKLKGVENNIDTCINVSWLEKRLNICQYPNVIGR